MKKVLAIALIVLFTAGISAPIFAAEQQGKKTEAAPQFETIRGEVTAIDATAKTAVIKESKSGELKTVKLSDKALGEIKVGEKVKIKIKAGSDVAESIKVIKGESKK
jgi:Cu/Ag efflux protein CusF